MSQLELFEDLVSLKYQVCNGLFLELPFSDLSRYGPYLPFFASHCDKHLQAGDDPSLIVHDFLWRVLGIQDKEEARAVLFLFLQLVERQVLLFDAIESAASGDLTQHARELLRDELQEELEGGRSIRLVLTAHPTQFYPETLLSIIRDLSNGVSNNDVSQVRKLLLQLGHTSFQNPNPPTPLSEAEMLIERFAPVFYQVFVEMLLHWEQEPSRRPRLELGFWPGGDRDGHPLVRVETTREVAQKLRQFVLRSYLHSVEQIRCRITFKGLVERIGDLRRLLQATLDAKGGYENSQALIDDLHSILIHVDQHQDGLYREEIRRLMVAVETFGFYFASLDIRQNSQVNERTVAALTDAAYLEWDEDKRLSFLQEQIGLASGLGDLSTLDEVQRDLVEVLQAVPDIQAQNGERGLHRFIISHTESACHVLEIMLLCQLCGCPLLDMVPLFESIEDLKRAPAIMEQLFTLPAYREQLKLRGETQTVMLGFSDGTKDGGYATCNWEIQRCKEKLQDLADQAGVAVIFFDGRGGPAGRGGGNTANYYQAVAERLPLHDIQQTIQGQTISSQYGTEASAEHNMLALLSTFLTKPLDNDWSEERALMEEISTRSHKHYRALREDPSFLPMLAEATPLNLLGDLNIASRPPKRDEHGQLSLANLRAIPFVGAWSLMKVNIPAYYGLGYALEEMIEAGQGERLTRLAKRSKYFSSLLSNACQALRKSEPSLTQYMDKDSRFGPLWQRLRAETERSTRRILELRRQPQLMADDEVMEASIAIREKIIQPLLVIQHYALLDWRQSQSDTMRKLILKSIPPSINASRNSA